MTRARALCDCDPLATRVRVTPVLGSTIVECECGLVTVAPPVQRQAVRSNRRSMESLVAHYRSAFRRSRDPLAWWKRRLRAAWHWVVQPVGKRGAP